MELAALTGQVAFVRKDDFRPADHLGVVEFDFLEQLLQNPQRRMALLRLLQLHDEQENLQERRERKGREGKGKRS